MPVSPSAITRRALVSLVALSMTGTPAMADFVGVSRCNAAGGSNPPVLHFVNGGERFIIRLGERGLTRRIILSERRALQWAAASGLFPDGTVFGNYAGFICGIQQAETEPEADPPDPRPRNEEPECEDDFCDDPQ